MDLNQRLYQYGWFQSPAEEIWMHPAFPHLTVKGLPGKKGTFQEMSLVYGKEVLWTGRLTSELAVAIDQYVARTTRVLLKEWFSEMLENLDVETLLMDLALDSPSEFPLEEVDEDEDDPSSNLAIDSYTRQDKNMKARISSFLSQVNDAVQQLP